MRSHCAVYVDAGYLLAAAATRLTGTSLRSGISVDHPLLIQTLSARAEQSSDLPLLRVYWYDAARDGRLERSHEEIGLLPSVKVRLGRIGYENEQKGVDLRIGLDMVAHARNGSIDTMFLVSGDDDLTEAVEEAQALGVRVTLLAVSGVDGRPHGVSRHLHLAADGLELLQSPELDAPIGLRTKAITAAVATSPTPTKQTDPPAPSPADLAQRRILTVPPGVRNEPSKAAPAVAYSSSTGGATSIAPAYERTEEEQAHLIEEVARRVLDTWIATATPEQRRDLHEGKPSIPRDVDRALLRDASEALGMYDLPDPVRYRLRDEFWENVDRQSN